MEAYKNYIETLAKSKSHDMINNSSAAHASVLAGAMFKFGEKSINIFTGKLHPETYATDDVVKEACCFIKNKDGKVRIIIQDKDSVFSNSQIAEHLFFGKLKKEGCSFANVMIRRIKEEKINEITFHFMTMDKSAFRFEPNNSEPVAFASFNKPDIAEKLNNKFDELWSSEYSTEVTI